MRISQKIHIGTVIIGLFVDIVAIYIWFFQKPNNINFIHFSFYPIIFLILTGYCLFSISWFVSRIAFNRISSKLNKVNCFNIEVFSSVGIGILLAPFWGLLFYQVPHTWSAFTHYILGVLFWILCILMVIGSLYFLFPLLYSDMKWDASLYETNSAQQNDGADA